MKENKEIKARDDLWDGIPNITQQSQKQALFQSFRKELPKRKRMDWYQREYVYGLQQKWDKYQIIGWLEEWNNKIIRLAWLKERANNSRKIKTVMLR